jgi:hypothetical protein
MYFVAIKMGFRPGASRSSSHRSQLNTYGGGTGFNGGSVHAAEETCSAVSLLYQDAIEESKEGLPPYIRLEAGRRQDGLLISSKARCLTYFGSRKRESRAAK